MPLDAICKIVSLMGGPCISGEADMCADYNPKNHEHPERAQLCYHGRSDSLRPEGIREEAKPHGMSA
jgi:hypothetical protein